MKKGLSIFLCILAVAITLCSCKSVKNKDAISDLTYVDDSGKVQMYSVDENGKAVTDESGEKVTTTTTTTTGTGKGAADGEMAMSVLVTDKDGEYVTDKKGNAVTSMVDAGSMVKDMMSNYEGIESLMPTTTAATKSNGKSSNTKSTTKSTAAVTTPAVDNTKDELLDEGSKTSNTTLMKTVVQPVIESGTFTIDGSIKAEGMDVATTFAFRNSKDYSISFNVSGFGIRVFSNKGKYYLALTTLGIYSEIPEDEFEDYKDMTQAFNSKDAKYVKTTKVKDGAITYTCEEYKSDDGIIKYYFNSKNEWKRMEIIDGDSVFIWKINSFKNTAKSSLFEVSKFWKKNDDITKALGQ